MYTREHLANLGDLVNIASIEIVITLPSKHAAQPKSVKANYCSPVRTSTKPASSILLKQFHEMMKICSTKAHLLGFFLFFPKNWIANAALMLKQVT